MNRDNNEVIYYADECENVADVSVLEALYCIRDKQLICITEEDEKIVKTLTQKIHEVESKIRKDIRNRINMSEEEANYILDIFQEYQNASNDRNAYFNRKYYMAGFDDGEKIILRNINK